MPRALHSRGGLGAGFVPAVESRCEQRALFGVDSDVDSDGGHGGDVDAFMSMTCSQQEQAGEDSAAADADSAAAGASEDGLVRALEQRQAECGGSDSEGTDSESDSTESDSTESDSTESDCCDSDCT